jgi:pyruvate,water dikinase
MGKQVVWFDSLGMQDVPQVGGKNASLGEMISKLTGVGVKVPGGFATTAAAFWEFLSSQGLDKRIHDRLAALDIENIDDLTRTGAGIREEVIATPLPPALRDAIAEAYARLGGDVSVAVRSSATAEDLPDASFAGQQETYLNVRGLPQLLSAVSHVFASLFNDRAIAYRVHHGFDHSQVALSAGIQRMVRSDIGASGVMFTIDTESGFKDVVFITAAYGLGETVVQGAVNPDEFYVHKPTLAVNRPAILRRTRGSKAIKMIYSDDLTHGRQTVTVDVDQADRRRFALNDVEVEALARQAVLIEQHYGRPMDIEWARDGEDGELYIVQARPETVQSRQRVDQLETHHLKQRGEVLATGRSIGQRIGRDMNKVQAGEVLITDMTDPDWEPIMKRAGAIVTNRGGRTCHAAIIARELGIPAVVGCSDATDRIPDGKDVTVSCAEGDTGFIYEGLLDFEVRKLSMAAPQSLPVKIMMNIGNPDRAFDFQSLPNSGIGLARLEFIINSTIGVHPRALLDYAQLPAALRREIDLRSAGYPDPVGFYITKLTEGIATLAAAFQPKPVIVRLSDFKSNEYANLLGGDRYEPTEENPMLGLRGSARYLSDDFRACFELECRALKTVRDEMGLTNVEIMVPFVRSVDEARKVIALLGANGLPRGVNGLRVIMMCEIPANAVLADDFLAHFDGFSIGSNDLTQLTLGVDRDAGNLTGFDERNPAVLKLMEAAIDACKTHDKYIGICGQAPSDFPEITRWLVERRVSSISLNPDSVLRMIGVIEAMGRA